MSNRGTLTFRAGALFAALASFTTIGGAQTPQPPYAVLQYSTLTGAGNSVTATQVPIVTSKGISYQNILLQFDVDEDGNITLSSGFPKFLPAARPLINGFKAGTYAGPSSILGGNALITVAGPAVASGGATEWTAAAASGASNETYPGTATWYVGSLLNNPIAQRLKTAGITSTAYSYGVATSPAGGAFWQTNTLIGVSQVGNTITFISFTVNGADHADPVDSITFTLKQ